MAAPGRGYFATGVESIMSADPISTYYDAGGIEVIEVIRAKLSPEQYRGYLLGNIIKYSCRLNHKGTPERDAEKISVYAKMLESSAKHEAGK